MSKEEYDQREAAAKVAQQQVDSAVQAVQQARRCSDLPTATGASGTPDASVPSDINETFPGVKYVVASAQQSLAQLGLPIDPSAPKTDKVVEKLGRAGGIVVSSIMCRPSKWPRRSCGKPRRRSAARRSTAAIRTISRASCRPRRNLEQAELDLSYTELRAPIAGFVNGRSVNAGNQVQVAQALMSVFPLNDVWIDANFKEGQLDQLRIGQSVDIYVDAYPGRVFPGRVAGFSAGTGAALSLLPPENATGNFVKVVQRLPVRIELTGPAPQETPLFIGLSVEPEVDLKTEPRGADAGSRLRGRGATGEQIGRRRIVIAARPSATGRPPYDHSHRRSRHGLPWASRNRSPGFGRHAMSAITAARMLPAGRPSLLDQSMGHRADRDDGHVHGGARHEHRQRLAAAHRRQSFGIDQRKHLGADELSGGQRDRAAAFRLAVVDPRPQAVLHDVRVDVHDQLDAVRPGDELGPIDFLPRAARDRRRRIAAVGTGDPGRHVSAAEARDGDGRVWHGDPCRADSRPDARRLDHRQLFLALDFLHQRAGRLHFAVAEQHRAPRSAASDRQTGRTAKEEIPESTISA